MARVTPAHAETPMRTRKPIKSTSRRRHERDTAIGYAVIVACALAFVGMAYGLAMIDAGNGVTVGQSLADVGL